jgi:photosystem II stability/assembly factor-like uncharacterized protein
MISRAGTSLAILLAVGLPGNGQLRAAPINPQLYSEMHWRLIGPFRAGWAEMIQGVPNDPNVFYLGASGGGVWRTDDAGQTWISLFDKGISSAIGAIAVAPSNPNVIYAGGGQPEPRYDVQSGRGVYKSTDGGKTWTDLGLHDTRYIGRIWASPTNPDNILVAAVGHFFGPSEARGVYRSTDGGKTWVHTLAPTPWTGVNDIAADPRNPSILFASAWEARQWPWQSYFTEISGSGSGIYRSEDGGSHWRKLSGGGWPNGPLGRISLAATRKAGKLRVYAVVDSKQNGGLWRSDDGGARWRRVNSEKAYASYYFNRVTADPRDPDVVYLTGQSMRRCDEGGARCEIFRGSPGGDDYHSIWIDPRHPDRMAAGSDQGAAISVNGGKSWSSWYNQPTGQFYHLAADNRFPYWIYSGQQDSGTVAIASRSDYGSLNWRDWHPVGGDERDYDIPDPVDPNLVYGSGLGGHVSRWDARTGQVTDISPWPVPNYGLRPTTVKHHFNWVTPLVSSRAGLPALYLGGEILFKTTDRGTTWTEISPDLTGKVAGAPRCVDQIAIPDAMACGYGTITAIEPSPQSAEELWVGSDTGLVSITRDGGAHWSQVTVPGIRSWSRISSIDVSAGDRFTAYVAIDAQRLDDFAPHAFKTHDGGRSWTPITKGLPADQIVSVVRSDPIRPGLLYAGTETGVFVSFDDGDSWQALRQNLPTAWARDLLVKGDDLIVATQGRAIWVLGDLALLRQLKPADMSAPARLFIPAPAFRMRFNNNHDTPLAPETPMGENPPDGVVFDYWLGAPPRGPVTLEIRDARGAVVRRFSSGDVPQPLPADRYFSADWVKPDPVFGASPGAHRWVWNLRRLRPAAAEYNFSIAAIWGLSTPLDPRGQLVEPGRYTAVLTVDGQEQEASFDILPDPRMTAADYHAAAAFSESLYEPMARAWRGYAETEALRTALGKRLPTIANPTLRSEAQALMKKLEPSDEPNSGFKGESGVLAGLETSAEASDCAPTTAMRTIAAETIARINADWESWQQVRGTLLEQLNQKLRAGKLPPALVPSESELRVGPPTGGEELP